MDIHVTEVGTAVATRIGISSRPSAVVVVGRSTVDVRLPLAVSALRDWMAADEEFRKSLFPRFCVSVLIYRAERVGLRGLIYQVKQRRAVLLRGKHRLGGNLKKIAFWQIDSIATRISRREKEDCIKRLNVGKDK